MTALLVCAVLGAMSDDDYAGRESGSRAAAGLVRNAPARYGDPISRAAAFHPSPEVRARCRRVCGPYREWLADSYEPKCARFPCVDWAVESGAFPECCWQSWMGPAAGCGGPCGSPEWSQYRRASELYVRSQIRCGAWDYADADAAVRKAWEAELTRFVIHYPQQVAVVEEWSRSAGTGSRPGR